MAFKRKPGRRAGTGFVLVVTLWVLAGIAIAVGLMTLWALDAVRGAASERERTLDALAIHGTRDTLLYLAATRAPTRGGQPVDPEPEDARALRLLNDFGAFQRDARGGELRLDGTPYRGLGGVVFALQDEAGLVPLVLPKPELLDHFLAVHGVDPGDVPRLRDALLDYTDMDQLRRLNGSEAREYEAESMPPPPNRQLLLPAEALRVLGWSQLPDPFRGQLPDLVSTFYGGAINLNTAPEASLATWIPGCPENCRLVVERRNQQPFGSAAEIQALIGATLAGDPMVDYRFLASDWLRITLWGRSGSAVRIHVRFTPLADQAAPWSILAQYPIVRPTEHVPAQPTGSDLLADAPPDRR